MDVLHVVASDRRRGAEMFAADLVRELRASGIEQAVAVVRGHSPAEVLFDAPTHHLTTTATGTSVRHHAALALRALIRRYLPAVVQAHGGEALKQSVVAAHRAGTALVYRRIGSTPKWMAGDLRRAAYRLLMSRADSIVAVADTIGNELTRQFSVPSEQLVVIPNGVDLTRALPAKDRSAVRSELRLSPEEHLIIVVGELNDEKNPIGALESALPCLTGSPPASLLFAGDGPLRAELEANIRARGVTDRVRLLGVRSDIADLLGASDVLLMSSRTEGMPAVAIEAGIAGLPVVAPRISGLPDVVRDGVTGILVDQGDTAAMAHAVARLLADHVERARFGRAGRKWCVENYDIKHVSQRYLDLYNQLRPRQLQERRA